MSISSRLQKYKIPVIYSRLKRNYGTIYISRPVSIKYLLPDFNMMSPIFCSIAKRSEIEHYDIQSGISICNFLAFILIFVQTKHTFTS